MKQDIFERGGGSGVHCKELFTVDFDFSVIVTVCRGPCAQSIYSTHGTPSFMHPLGFKKKRNSGCILPLSYAYFFIHRFTLINVAYLDLGYKLLAFLGFKSVFNMWRTHVA